MVSFFIITNKIATKKALLDALSTPENVTKAKTAIKGVIRDLKESQSRALTKEYERILARQIELWGKVAASLD